MIHEQEEEVKEFEGIENISHRGIWSDSALVAA